MQPVSRPPYGVHPNTQQPSEAAGRAGAGSAGGSTTEEPSRDPSPRSRLQAEFGLPGLMRRRSPRLEAAQLERSRAPLPDAGNSEALAPAKRARLEDPVPRVATEHKQLFEALHSHLLPKNHDFTLSDAVTAIDATCWNWALHGAARGKHEVDPSWAFLYVSESRFGYDRSVHERAHQNPVAKRSLDQARRDWHKAKENLKDYDLQDKVHRSVLQALCAFNGLREADTSPLEIALIYDILTDKRDVPMYRHMELVYASTVTLTKSAGEPLKAFNGESDLEGSVRTVSISIDPASLSQAHATALRDLVQKAQPEA